MRRIGLVLSASRIIIAATSLPLTSSYAKLSSVSTTKTSAAKRSITTKMSTRTALDGELLITAVVWPRPPGSSTYSFRLLAHTLHLTSSSFSTSYIHRNSTRRCLQKDRRRMAKHNKQDTWIQIPTRTGPVSFICCLRMSLGTSDSHDTSPEGVRRCDIGISCYAGLATDQSSRSEWWTYRMDVCRQDEWWEECY